jgi:radical SAM-linked protein
LRVELRLAVRERARFLSHLEMVDVLLAALRRAGFEVALSQGMRPKPVISLALARGVGVASEDEHLSVELVGAEHDPDDVLRRLAATCPRGVVPLSCAPAGPKADVTGATYRLAFDAPPAAVEAACASYRSADELVVERSSPKGRRRIDVRRFAPDPVCEDGAVHVRIAILEDGSAKPDEVARALDQRADGGLGRAAITRLSVHTAPRGARVGAVETP